MTAETENIFYLRNYDRERQNSIDKSGIFDPDELRKSEASDCNNDREPEIATLSPTSYNSNCGCRLLSQLLGHTFVEFSVVKNPRLAVGTSTKSVIVPEM